MAAVGESIIDSQNIASGARLSIQPPSGEEWIITNIYTQAAVTLERFDGTLITDADVRTSRTIYAGMSFRVNNTDYIRVKNDDAGSKVISYDAVRVR